MKTLISLIIFMLSSGVLASPASLTYQGRILKSDGTPLEYNSVSFIFQITDSSGQCVIYQEQVNGINMENSGGVFDVSIGQGTVTYPITGSFSILDAFNNSGSFICQGGVPYNASTADTRKLRVQFHDGLGWRLISPDSVIRSVPFAGYALSAQKLGNNPVTDFVLKTGIPTCANGTFLSWDGTQLTCQPVSGGSGGTVTNVTSANAYVTITNGTSTPQITLNVGTAANTVASGNDPRLVNALQVGANASGDLGGTYPGPAVIALQGVPVNATTPTMGQFFKFNGTTWTGSAIAISDVTNLSAQLSGYMTQVAFNADIASASCSSSQTMYWNSVSGNFQCQAINVGLAGDVTGSIGAAKVVALQNNPVDTTVPTNGQVLKWDGTKWAPTTLPAINPGTVTNVSGTAPISVATGSSTPVISISQANTSTAGYLSSTDWNTFNSKQAAGNYVTALTGDVTAAGPGSATATVAKLQGSALTITTPASGDYLKYNGMAFVNSALSASDLTGTLPAASLPAFSGDVTSSVGSTTLTLSNVGTAGTYYKVTTDAKGRVTSGAASLLAADIPNLDWSKITSGKPTTLSGYGITDSLVNNAGNTPSIASGLNASKPAAGTAGRIYISSDSKEIYRDNGTTWDLISSAVGAGGTITGVTAGTGLTGGGTSGTVTLNVDAGTGANQIVQLNGSSKLPAVDGSQLTNLQASQIPNLSAAKITSGVLAVSQGGTGQGSYTDGQLLIGNTATGSLSKANLTAGSGVTITNGNGNITISAAGSGGTVTNVTGSVPINVATGTSTPVISFANGSAAGQVHRWDGTSAWVATKLNYMDLINNVSGSPWPGSACTAGQAVTWSSASDSFTCSTLSIATSQLTGTFAAAQMPALSGDVTSSAGSTTLTLANSGVTAGTYKSVTVDGKGRVTAGTNPTTLSGFGITDGVQNAGNAVSMQSGADASKGAASTNGRFYFATDTQKIYIDNGSSWILIASSTGSGGTVTNVTGSAPISVATGTTTPVVSITKADAIHDGYLAQADFNTFNGKLGTTLNSANIFVGNASNVATSVALSGDATISNTGALTIANNAVTTAKINDAAVTTAKLFSNPGINRLIATDGTTGAALASFACTSAQTLTWNVATGWQCTAQSALTVGSATNFSGSLSGDVTGTQAATVVGKLQGRSVASTAPNSNDVLTWNGTNWAPAAPNGTSQWTTSGSDIYYNTGKVGIGTTSPIYPLDVTGNINASGSYRINGSVVLQTNGSSSVGVGGAGLGSGSNSYLGNLAGYSTGGSGSYNSGVGAYSLQYSSGNYNSGLGYMAGQYVGSGTYNTAVGANSMNGVSGSAITGNYNTALGASALGRLITSGARNTGSGYQALYSATTATDNVAMGYSAGSTITTGASNVVLGPSVASTTLTTGSNNILIGTSGSVDVPSSSTSNFLNIGNTIYGNLSTGSVGIGTTSPTSTLTVNGAVANSASISNASTTVNFASGNLQYSTASCGAFTLYNLKDGGTYTFAVQGTTSATCSFTAYSDLGSTSLSVRMPADIGATTSGKHTLFTFMVMGGFVYVAWNPGY